MTLEGSLIHDFTSTNGEHGDGLFIQPSYDVSVVRDVFARDDCIPLYVNYAPKRGNRRARPSYRRQRDPHRNTEQRWVRGLRPGALARRQRPVRDTRRVQLRSTNDLGIRRSNSGGEVNTGIRIVGNVVAGIAATNAGSTYGCGAGTTALYNVLSDPNADNCGSGTNLLGVPLPLISEDTESTSGGLILTPTLGDYSLVSGSPALADVPVSWCTTDAQTQQACADVTTDIKGNPRPDPAHPAYYDAGAYENR